MGSGGCCHGEEVAIWLDATFGHRNAMQLAKRGFPAPRIFQSTIQMPIGKGGLMAGKPSESPNRFAEIMERLKGGGGGGSSGSGPSKRQVHFSLIYFLIALMLISWLQNRVFEQQVQKIPYSEFKQMVRDGRVDKLTLEPDRIRGMIKDAKENQSFVTVRVPDEELVKQLDDKGIQYSGRLESKWLENILSWLLPMVFF
ncbi:MAG TPA: hypothetical protein DEO88_16005, partial [Syntrophobacteraceae bacterium]|nr:hypothetical protein [Syntrophobacteraceae bacterium]